MRNKTPKKFTRGESWVRFLSPTTCRQCTGAHMTRQWKPQSRRLVKTACRSVLVMTTGLQSTFQARDINTTRVRDATPRGVSQTLGLVAVQLCTSKS